MPKNAITKLILASASPRRAQLLRQAGYKFTPVEPPLEEPDTMGHDVPPPSQAEALSYFKARSVRKCVNQGLIIAADTIVVAEEVVFGKPLDATDARRIITALAGTSQSVITGLTLLDAETGRRLISHDISIVKMRPMSSEAVDEYVKGGAWIGKAGGYGIQDQGDAFVERIEGSFTNVVGLPMELLANLLAQWGYEAPKTAIPK